MASNPVLLRRVSLVLAVLGIAVAAYMTWAKYANQSVVCLTGSQCDEVQNHETSEVAGIPVAVIGLTGYVAIVAVLVLEEVASGFTNSGPMLVFGLTLVGFVYSLYLTALELFVIYAICSWCVTSAVIMTLLFVISIIRALRTAQA
jgi:uncharacterized membrane protein